MNAALAFEDVACFRGGRLLFEQVRFALAPGDVLLVRGQNGAGKSSLIRLAAGLLAPAAGAIRCSGARALLAETAALDPERELSHALRFWAALDGRADAVAEALASVALADLARVPVRLLSTGQRRRAAFARVIASGAPIWLLDEPANGLDAGAVAMLEAAIERHRTGGGIALIATHLPLRIVAAQELAL